MLKRGPSASDESLPPGRKPQMEMLMESSHAAALHSKHAGLEARLKTEMSRPAPDDTTIKQIKLQKLRIKQELEHI